MAVAWFLAPYSRRAHPRRIQRYCAMDDHTALIRADGGDWTETEVLGQHAIVKVRASAATLTAIAGTAGITRLPVDRLDDPLSSLNTSQRNALRNRVLALGYTTGELNAALPNNIGTYTLRDVLRFVATRRRKVRYDDGTDAIVDDGADQPVRLIAEVDEAVV